MKSRFIVLYSSQTR